MSLQPGTRLHHYEILEAIGAGGMGEVYRARDGNLDRDVAVKVLPRGMADNPLNLVRLEREAKAIAALSHPNILSVFDFGTYQDTAYVVTELLEGQTLGERLQEGPLPPRKVTEIGRQIARGLAAAHDKGIVHRDLKPDNLFLTRDGRVKILDFGLASSGGARDQDVDIGSEETVVNLTQPGTVLGTVTYMSPEQVRGKPTDNRSDLFSLGTVLYEMVSGVRPFQRETPPETMTAILKEDPADLATLATDIPPALAAIIRRCIEKAAGERFHSAHDLAFSLEALSGSTVSSGKVAAIDEVPEARHRPGWMTMAALVLVGLVVGAGGFFLFLPTPAGDGQASLDFLELSSRRGVVTNARFTGTDGAALYSASWDGGPLRLYPASPGARTSDPVGTENAALLSISRSGQLALSLDQRHTVGWEAVGTLAVAQPGGTAPRRILENVHAADWGPDGQTMAVAREVDGAVQLEYPIGTLLYRSPGWISALRVHPDGSRILIMDCPIRGDNRTHVKIVDLDGTVTELGQGWAWGLAWDPDGQSAWYSNGPAIFRVREGGEPRRIYRSANNLHLMDIAADGRILAASATMRRELIARAPGAAEEINLSWLDWSTPTILSDDGMTAVFEEGNQHGPGGYGVYLRDLAGTAPLLLGFGSAVGLAPDGQQLAVLKRKFQPDPELVLTPTGVGTSTTLPLGGLRLLGAEGRWLRGPDSGDPGDPDALVILGRLAEGPPQLFHLPLVEGAMARAITPADHPLAAQGHIVSRDGTRAIVKPVQGSPVGFTLDGEGPQVLPGLEPTDLPLGFDQDGTHCFVLESGRIPAAIVRVDLESGEREPWRELAPTDKAGVFQIDRVRISADGSAHVYSVRRVLTELMLIEGMRQD